MTVWSMLQDCVAELDEPLRRSEIVGWFRRHRPEVNEATLGAHIQAATGNAASRAQHSALGSRPALVRRVDHGLYVRLARPEPTMTAALPATASGPADAGAAAGIMLIGCVRTKLPVPAPAAELFASPLFAGRRRFATASGRPWYILSAEYGLLAPDDVIGPYDVYLAEQSREYRRAWGVFVVAQLACWQGDLRGRVVEVHAGRAYAEPREPLAGLGAMMTVPAALRQGEQLAWYGSDRQDHPAGQPEQPLDDAAEVAAGLTRILSDPRLAISPQDFLARGPHGLQCPGLYSWWVDDEGAADLSRGLGEPVQVGLIYAGQAGARRWPSGQRSVSTLWARISGMHLAGAAEFSTFRRSLAAILRPVIGRAGENDARLSDWMNAHLRVAAAAVPDSDTLGAIEAAVLDSIDPPLSLRGRPPSPVRAKLTELRGQRQDGEGA